MTTSTKEAATSGVLQEYQRKLTTAEKSRGEYSLSVKFFFRNGCWTTASAALGNCKPN